MNKSTLLVILFVAALFVACDSKREYEYNEIIENDTWNIKKAYKHQFEIKDSMQWYNMYLNVRNTNDYKYSNLFLYVTTTFPHGQKAKDTVECVLANTQGKWFGKGNGKYKDCRIIFKPKFRFSQVGTYHLQIEHGMREQDVVGISEIGIRLEKFN